MDRPSQLTAMISSTALDLPEHRRQVVEACLCEGIFPIGMEHLPARDANGMRVSLEMVDKADIYIGVYAWRYGWIPDFDNPGQISITEMEFNRASDRKQRGELKEILIFVMHDDHPIRARDKEDGAEAQEKLRQFKERASKGRVRLAFKSAEELRGQVIQSLAEARRNLESSQSDHASVPGVRRPNNLPYASLGTLFKGREEFLGQIRSALGTADKPGQPRAAAITAPAATVHGLGGIGKTRAAVEYAHRHADEFTALLFIRADSPEALKTNLAGLCGPLVLDLDEKTAKELDVQFAAVLRWLQQNPGWLLILDNVDTEPAAREVEALLAQLAGAGQVLITSRLSQWPAGVVPLGLDVLAEADATSFLLERTATGRRPLDDDPAQARELAVVLGQLALALEQAGAYINTRRLTFAQYLTEWRRQQDHVLDWFDERVMQYPKSVAVTWQTSFDQLSPSARQLLNRLAWFAPDPIPESLFEVPASVPEPTGDTPAPTANPADPLEALAELDKYSLVTRAPRSPTFTVHRLVQAVTRQSLAHDPRHEALTEALRWLSAAFVGDPDDVRSWPVLDPLACHAEACAQYADQAGITDPTARLLNHLGLFYSKKARHAEAEPLMRRALAIQEKKLGPDHPTVAIVVSNLAALLHATNRPAEAEPLYRRALAINEKNFGLDHPMVALCLNNLAQLLSDTNRLAEAEPLMRRALAIDEKNLGPDHPKVAIRLNNIAVLLKDTNRMIEAETFMRRAVAIDEKGLGPEHPTLAIHLSNLAQLLQETNRAAEAEPMMLRVVSIFEQNLDANHPKIATALSNLANLMHDLNRLAEAAPLLRRALAIVETCFGPNHPSVACDLGNLGAMLLDSNQPAEAEPLLRRALAIDEKSLGPDHPDVARDLNNLAHLLKAKERLAEAEPLMRRGLKIFLKFTRTTGYPHPHLQAAIRNYVGLLQAMGSTEDEALLKLHELGPEIFAKPGGGG